MSRRICNRIDFVSVVPGTGQTLLLSLLRLLPSGR